MSVDFSHPHVPKPPRVGAVPLPKQRRPDPLAKLYTFRSTYLPDRKMGPVRFVDIKGKERAVEVTRDVDAGELLLVSQPLACVRSPLGACPSAEELAENLQSQRYTPAEEAVLRALYNGRTTIPPSSRGKDPNNISKVLRSLSRRHRTEEGAVRRETRTRTRTSSAKIDHHDDCDAGNMSNPDATNTGESEAGSSSGSRALSRSCNRSELDKHTDAETEDSQRRLSMAPDDVMAVLRYNCFGTESEDRAVAAVQHREPHGILGLWPEFSMINHSCCQNSVCYVVGDRMVVRAARDIAVGSEVTKNYLGMTAFVPAAVRQERLLEEYGFRCTCERCQQELSLPDATSAALSALHDKVTTTLQPVLSACMSEGTEQEVKLVMQELHDSSARLAAILQSLDLPDQQDTWIRAAAYDLFDAMWVGSAWLDRPEAVALGCKLEVVEELALGSDCHLYSTFEWYLLMANLHSRGDPVASEARADVLRAHRVRYGNLGPIVMSRLIDVRWGDVYPLGGRWNY